MAARSVWLGLPSVMLFVLGIHMALALFVVFVVPFPTQIDEIQHLSVIRAQYEHPTIFPDWSQYKMLRLDDLTQWSGFSNYINHPSLYYLMLSPLMLLTSEPLLFRLTSVLLSTAALAIGMVAVHRRFAADVVPPGLYAVMAASFPKAAVVGGMVNNDNLAALAAAMVFGGMLGLPGASWWLAVGLAVAGWTKLTAFIGVAAVAGAWLGMGLLTGRVKWSDRMLWYACVGVMLGAVPYLVTFMRIGQFVWVNEAFWRVPVAQRLPLDLMGFAGWFFKWLVMKWPAWEQSYSLPVALILILTPLALAAAGLRHRVIRPWGQAYAIGLVVLLTIHFCFGWRSYVTLGDLTIMQPRYYNILWPGIALAATMGIADLARRWRPAATLAVAICLMPTMLGTLVNLNF
ncbi:hypothetical protein [Sphingobium sp. HWE2-09]|uniref:hypothetical protein n=1 Tax=Sphingobium sp. HWE2-09 TaxID=3108390 RepID=UPI002DCF5723|nr:hypothetical protein [Sphingobium sp. HWE2-09]